MSATNALPLDSENPNSGPYVDTVKYLVNGYSDDRILMLQTGIVDAILDPISLTHVSTLESDPDIGIHSISKNSYGQLTINCRKYPLNISAFRRAIAYALDKNRVVSEVWDTHATAHDSVFPLRSSWCIEEDLPWNYYADQSVIGNQILDDLGFLVDSGTNKREMPNGTQISIAILSADTLGITDIIADALDSLHIDVHVAVVPWLEAAYPKDYHPNYDMAYFTTAANDPDSILTDYLSDYVDTEYLNQFYYENDTFDALYDDFHSGTTYEEVFEAVSAMQEHLHENVPSIIVYEGIDYQAYRITDFTGHIEDDYWGIVGPWTNLKVHSKTGNPFGGIYTIAIPEAPITLNPFLAFSEVSRAITENLHSSLFKIGPNNVAYPDLAENAVIENHASNPAVPEGQTWVRVDITDDAVWSDGEPLTAEDVAFTFMYIKESQTFGNPQSQFGWPNDYISSHVLSPYVARIVLSGESYLNIQGVLNEKIIPKHVFNEETGLGYDEWSYSGPVATCGPFYVSDSSPSFVELNRSMDYHWPSGLEPQILSANDVTYSQGTTGNEIVWEVTDEDPLDYTIYQDGSIAVTDDWNGSNIVHNVDGLAAGTFNFTLILTDISGHIVTDTVRVIVTTGTPGGDIPDILVIGTIVGSTAVILVVGVVIFKKRR
jgi:ABC-type transport system substrate-binding protein